MQTGTKNIPWSTFTQNIQEALRVNLQNQRSQSVIWTSFTPKNTTNVLQTKWRQHFEGAEVFKSNWVFDTIQCLAPASAGSLISSLLCIVSINCASKGFPLLHKSKLAWLQNNTEQFVAWFSPAVGLWRNMHFPSLKAKGQYMDEHTALLSFPRFSLPSLPNAWKTESFQTEKRRETKLNSRWHRVMTA